MASQETTNTKIRNLSDKELILMINSPSDYFPEALAIAKDEVEKRGGIHVLEPVIQDMIKKEKEEERKEKEEEKAEEKKDAKISFKIAIIFILVILIVSFFFDWGESKTAKFLKIPVLVVIAYLIRMIFSK
jgi:uncharacterized protein YqhQ